MKYLITYAYEGKRRGERVSGQGSTVMTVNRNKITPEVIDDAVEGLKNTFAEKGMKINSIAPMGWYKFDDEEGSDSE